MEHPPADDPFTDPIAIDDRNVSPEDVSQGDALENVEPPEILVEED
ncbi:MAG: hypothetical protein NVSMB59_06410 [Vulcanimicrobiaceae bacterium]